MPEIIKELDCEPAASEDNRYKLLSLQGFLQRFYLEVGDKLQREKVAMQFAFDNFAIQISIDKTIDHVTNDLQMVYGS